MEKRDKRYLVKQSATTTYRFYNTNSPTHLHTHIYERKHLFRALNEDSNTLLTTITITAAAATSKKKYSNNNNSTF